MGVVRCIEGSRLAFALLSVKMSTGPDPRFPVVNSSISGWGWRRINPHGEGYGRNVVPIRDGGDGDGCLVPDPDPYQPAPRSSEAGPCKGPISRGGI